MNVHRLSVPVLIPVFLFISVILGAQGINPAQPETEIVVVGGDSVKILPFENTGLTQAFSSSTELIDVSSQKRIKEEEIAAFDSEADSLFSQIEDFLGDSAVISLEGINVRELDQIVLRAEYFGAELDRLQGQLDDRANGLELVTGRLTVDQKRWQLTMNSLSEEELPGSRIERIRRTIGRIDSVRALLISDLGVILEQQDRLAVRTRYLQQLGDRVREKKSDLGETLLQRDMPVLFKDLSGLGDSPLVRGHLEGFGRSVRADYDMLVEGYTAALLGMFLALLALLGSSIWFRKSYPGVINSDRFKLSADHLLIINSPVITSVFILTLMIRFLIPDLPRTFASVNLLLMMIPLVIFMIRMYGRMINTWILVLAVSLIAIYLYELSYYPDILQRLMLLVLSGAGVWLMFRMYLKRPLDKIFSSNFVVRFSRLLVLLFAAMEVLAILANLTGAFQLAEFFTLLPIQISVLAIAIHMAARVGSTVIFIILSINIIQRLNVVREEFDVIYRKLVRILDLILMLVFLSIALGFFRVKDTLFQWGRGVFTNGIKIGEVDITLGNILILIFIVWLSIVITRIISHIMEKDVFARVKMAKGVPATIILLLKIVLISAGFFFAMAAAGMELTNLSIVLGAFSVGIGFGLQNIFNNMVSGLILAFERPIKVGDVVQVGELLGTVRSIGLRSSTVKSFDGAEVIVPNGNLISDQMINWTLSDSYRRMDIRIGVEYGTDPQAVLDILHGIAEEHREVRKEPRPKAFFISFGDSSLDFRLLAWCHLDNRLETESEIKVEINRRLKEAGIGIPFPQRDVHIIEPENESDRSAAVSKAKPAQKKPPLKSQPSGKKPEGRSEGPGME